MGASRTKPRKTITPVRPIEAVMIPTKATRKRKAVLIGLGKSKHSRPQLKLQHDKAQRRILYDFHLFFNHATPNTIMETLRNPNLQYDQSKIPKSVHASMDCGPCRNAKMKSAPHHPKDHSYQPGEAISSDVAGPMNFRGQRLENAYFVTCIDAASRYAICIPIVDRTKVVPFIEASITQFMSTFNSPPKIFVSDDAKEYVSKEMTALLHSFNIQHSPTTTYTAQENGISERMNQTLMHAVKVTLYTADLPPQYWQYELLDAVDKYNQLHHSSIVCSLFMKVNGAKASDITGLNIFGQIRHCPNRKPKSKLEPKAQVVKYWHRVHPKHILVEMEYGSTSNIRATDFHHITLTLIRK